MKNETVLLTLTYPQLKVIQRALIAQSDAQAQEKRDVDASYNIVCEGIKKVSE